MKQNRILSLVGLATKAGKTVSGEFSTEKAVKTGTAYLVIVSEEASGNTKKKFQNMCSFYQVPIYFFGTIKYPCICTEQRMNWAQPWEKNSERPWQ